MNYKLVIRLLVMMPLLIQGSPDDSSPEPSSTNRVPGVLPWILGAAVTGGCYWAHSRFNSNTQKPSSEEEVKQAELAFKKCLQIHQKGPGNSNGFPAQCSDEALEFLLRCEFLRQPELRVNEALTSFKQYQDNK